MYKNPDLAFLIFGLCNSYVESSNGQGDDACKNRCITPLSHYQRSPVAMLLFQILYFS